MEKQKEVLEVGKQLTSTVVEKLSFPFIKLQFSRSVAITGGAGFFLSYEVRFRACHEHTTKHFTYRDDYHISSLGRHNEMHLNIMVHNWRSYREANANLEKDNALIPSNSNKTDKFLILKIFLLHKKISIEKFPRNVHIKYVRLFLN